MKKIFLTCVFALWIINCFGQFTNDFHTGAALKGQIDSVVAERMLVGNVAGKHDTTILIEQLTYIYNKKKQLIESDDRGYLPVIHGSINGWLLKNVYTYDNGGNLTGIRLYSATGELVSEDNYTRKDSVIETKAFSCPDNSQIGTDILKINVADRIIERDSYVKDVKGVVLFTKSYFTYDEAGRLIREDTYSADGTLMFKHTCKYNADGDIIEDNNPFGDRIIHTYQYDGYDKMHNWLKQTEYMNQTSIIIHKRRIIYY